MNIVIPLIILILLLLFIHFNFAMRRVHSPHRSYDSIKEVIYIDYQDSKIYGELIKPEKDDCDTLIIGSHGFNGSYIYFRQALGYRLSEEGYALYCFDFINGSKRSKSGGSIEYMSALDEVEQLKTVYSFFKDRYKNIILAGESQGGLISTLASKDLTDIKSLILYYPAYCAVDDAKKRWNNNNTNELFKIKFKSDYTKELTTIDLADYIKNINVPTILIHGDKDRTVDVKYAYWAKQLNPEIELHIIKDNDHGFNQAGRVEASNYVSYFLSKL